MIAISDSAKRRIAQLYDPRLPYHNFAHALNVFNIGSDIVEACKAEGVPIDEAVVGWGTLTHDAGYHQDHRQKGFRTKEEYSAHITGPVLEELHVPPKTIIRVHQVTIATHREASFGSNEEKVVRAADLAGLINPYETFLVNCRNLKLETELLTGKEISLSDWKEETSKIINFYLGQDICLTSHYRDTDGSSRFHTMARRNLKRFLEDTFE